MQTLADLDRAAGGEVELGVLKITIQQFFRVSGSSTQRQGVVPDIVLPDPAGHIDSGERELEHAIAWSQVTAAAYDKVAAPWTANGLVQKSATRVTKHPLFSKMATMTDLLRERAKDTRVPLARPAWEARRKAQRTAIEAAAPDLKTAPSKFTVTAIADPISAGAGAAAAPAAPNGKPDDRAKKWADALARDPWVEESVNILGDMK